MGFDNLYLFIAAGLLLNLTPGPDVLYIVANGLRGGARAGVAAALGITAGCFVHIAAAAIGVSALIAASATAFTVLKWLGAAYLVYVGVSMLWPRQKQNTIKKEANYVSGTLATGQIYSKNGTKSDLNDTDSTDQPTDPAGLMSVFIRGFWTNALNPKVALFFLAFLPQFIAPDAANKTLNFALLGLLFNLNALPINVGYGLGAAWVSKRLQNQVSRSTAMQSTIAWLERGAGALFVYFGVKLALADNRV
jgi:threonine/homoserine/homoserine lactone efflux protein